MKTRTGMGGSFSRFLNRDKNMVSGEARGRRSQFSTTFLLAGIVWSSFQLRALFQLRTLSSNLFWNTFLFLSHSLLIPLSDPSPIERLNLSNHTYSKLEPQISISFNLSNQTHQPDYFYSFLISLNCLLDTLFPSRALLLNPNLSPQFPIHSTNETSTSSPQDCFSCRLTGTLAFAGLGGYSLLEAYRLLNPTSKSNPNPLTSATSAPTSTPTSSTSNAQKNINEVNKKILKSVGGKGGSRLHAGALVVFGLACLGAGSVRWSKWSGKELKGSDLLCSLSLLFLCT